jgi:Pyridoxamine 5'-phosphate oxidase
MTTWAGLEDEAPQIARPGRHRLAETRIVLLASIRSDGLPRISPVEPYFIDGQLIFGTIAWSAKTQDLIRDPRCVLHSSVDGPSSGVDELKLYAEARECDDQLRDGCREGWWTEVPRAKARVFSVDIRQATLVSWDLEGGQLTLKTWSAPKGYAVTTRAYP